MARPRNNPDAEKAENHRKAMQELREKLGISCARFSALLGLSTSNLAEREYKRIAWKPSEIDHAKDKVREHLIAATRALDALKP